MITVVDSPGTISNRAAGQYNSIEVQYNSTLSLSGKTIKFNPGMWIDVYTQGTEIPTLGYTVTYPFFPGTVQMSQIASANNAAHRNLSAEIIVIDNRNFTIRLNFINFCDIDDFVNTSNVPPITRVLSKGTGGSNVYDTSKKLVFWIGYMNGSNHIVNYEDITFAAGHFNKSINGGAPISNWAYVLTAGNQFVQGFSITDDTKISFFIPGSPVQQRWYFGIIKSTNPAGSGTFWDGTSMQYAEIVAGTKNTIGTIPNNRIIAQTGVVNFTGGVCSATIDKDYFTTGENYQFFIAVQIGSTWQSWISPEIGVIQDYSATYGDIAVTGEVLENGLTYGNCLNGAIVGTTLRVCFEMDKASYNADLVANGVGISFDDNYQSVQIIRVDGIPVQGGVPTGAGLPTVIADSATSLLACTDILVDAADIGENIYIAAIWTFDVVSPQGNYTDTIISYSRYMPSEANDPIDIGLAAILVNGVTQQPVPPFICNDIQGELTAQITLNDVCDSNDYTVTLHEIDNPSNTFNDCIISSDIVGATMSVVLNLDCLPTDIELCITVTFICDSSSQSECIECFEYNIEIEVNQVGVRHVGYNFNYDFSAFTNFNVVNFSFFPLYLQPVFESSNNSQGTYWFYGPFGYINLSVLAVVEANGCLYPMCFTFLIAEPELGQTETITAVACPDVSDCQEIIQFGNPCEEITPTLTLECTEPGTVTISGAAPTAFNLFYNLDGGLIWTPYTVPIVIDPETNPSCSVYAWMQIEATEFCDEIGVYDIIDDCCPPIECPEFTCEAVVIYTEETNNLFIGIDCGSEETPDSYFVYWSIDGGLNFNAEFNNPANINVEFVDQVIWRVEIYFNETYPLCDPNIFEFEGTWDKEGAEPGSCDSLPTLTAEVVNGCHLATPGGDTFFVDTDVIYFSIDNGVTFNVWDNAPICGVDIVVWKREVCYTNDCPCDCMAAVSIKNDLIDTIDCECVTWAISINKTGDILCPVIFGLDDYVIDWHVGGNSGYVPIGYDVNGCVTLTTNGLYRLTVTDENGCKKWAYRMYFNCEDCPVCELTIEKINEDGFGTYLASLDCEATLNGEWQKWDVNTNDWIPVGSSNPFMPQDEGLYRYIGDLDGNPDCPIEASVLVCEGVMPFCECYQSSVLKANTQNLLFDIVLLGNYSLRDNEGASFNFPYDVSDPAEVLLLIADLEAFYSENPSDCTPQVEFIDDGTNYIIQINCISGLETAKIPSFDKWRTLGNLQSVYSLNTDCNCEPESQSQSMSESTSNPLCEGSNYAYSLQFGEGDFQVTNIVLQGVTLDSGTPGMNFPYSIDPGGAGVGTLTDDLETYFAGQGVTQCCDGAEVPVKARIVYASPFYTLYIECINQEFLAMYKPLTLLTSDGNNNFVESVDDPLCCITCENKSYRASDINVNGVVTEIDFDGIALSGEPEFSFPYNLAGSAGRNDLMDDFYNWVFNNNYYQCCPGQEPPLLSGMIVTDPVDDLVNIEVTCWSTDNPTPIDVTQGGAVPIVTPFVEYENEFCCQAV